MTRSQAVADRTASQ